MSGKDVIHAITRLLTDSVTSLTPDDYHRLMLAVYRKLQLVDNRNQWRSGVFCAISDQLLPRDLDSAEVCDFIRKIARYAAENSYLVDFLEQAARLPLTEMRRKAASQGATVFPEVIAYALVMERLTAAEREDWKVLEACHRLWSESDISAENRRKMTLFDRFKRFSVNRFTVAVLGFHRSGKVDPVFLRTLLPENILEAILDDVRLGFRANGYCGWILAKNRPANSKTTNMLTGEGPTEWTSDGKAILTRYPLPAAWNDLYATWNMAFVGKYGSFPYKLVKLLIPQVNHYSQCPEEYMYNRALALYTHLHFSSLGGDIMIAGERMEWADDELTHLWGSVNRKSAKHYQQSLDSARKQYKIAGAD